MARKKLEELYEPEMVKEYVQAHLEYAAKVIAPFLPDMSVQDIINTVEKDGAIPKKRIVIAKNLSEEKAELLRQAIQNARVQGFRFETSSKRVYSVPECMVHILGYIAQTKDSGPRPVALSGLEKQLDDQLLGHNGIREYRKDSRGRIIPSADSRFKDAAERAPDGKHGVPDDRGGGAGRSHLPLHGSDSQTPRLHYCGGTQDRQHSGDGQPAPL